jgi:ribokinase
MPEPLNIDIDQCHYKAMLGVGGIGTGKFFELNGAHTLGREESRSGHFLDRRDYCKLHIIAHYVKTLLGPVFATFPIGRIGSDKEGQQLLAEMDATGLDRRYIEVVDGGQTLFSFCFVYPDGSGGNLTTDNSVNATVDAAFVNLAEPIFRTYAGHGIALAAPESSMESRTRLLELASQYAFLRVASLTSEEITTPLAQLILTMTDVLAINIDEAAILSNHPPDRDEPAGIVQSAVELLRAINPDIRILLTAGTRGSWAWDGEALHHSPAFQVPVASSAGAGDAHLAGLIAGIVSGLAMSDALMLGVLVAALSVTSPHTIHPSLDRALLHRFVGERKLELSPVLLQLLASSTVVSTR